MGWCKWSPGLPRTRTSCVSPPHVAFQWAVPSTLMQSPSHALGPNTGSIPWLLLRPVHALPHLAHAGHLPGIGLFVCFSSSKELERGNYTLARSQPSPSHPPNPQGCRARTGARISGPEQGAGGDLPGGWGCLSPYTVGSSWGLTPCKVTRLPKEP